ncbi:MAG: hypothetical protein AMXMBFR6_15480 [Betaproteobacteria bacterium]
MKLKPSARIALSIQLAFATTAAWSLPEGANIGAGQVGIQAIGPGAMQISASHGAIINWRGFSIGAQELVRFLQPSAGSAVLNRVTGPEISQIMGQLQANGRVFLINPNGIVVGAGARIDTAGFVGSTLGMADADFLNGKLRFQGDARAGAIDNQGLIRTGPDGRVLLIAPDIRNSGVIQTDGGKLLLAAGQKITLTSLDFEGIQFEVQAPTDRIVNLGQLIADGGAIQAFAGTLKHSGEIRASRLAADADGSVRLVASHEATISAGSTIRVDGPNGGRVLIQTTAGDTRVAGSVSAQGSEGRGGDIQVLGRRVALQDGARLDASGETGGGRILVGGDYQGKNPDVQNALRTEVAAGAELHADARRAGSGGQIVIWADENTRYHGSLSARGGAAGGDGGQAEVSGKQNLEFVGRVDLGAPQGHTGTLLLDPKEIQVNSDGGSLLGVLDEFADFALNILTVSPAALAAVQASVVLQAIDQIIFNAPVTLTAAGAGLTAIAQNGQVRVNFGAGITTNGGAVSLQALGASSGLVQVSAPINTQGAAISLSGRSIGVGSNLSTGGGALDILSTTGSNNTSGTFTTAGGAVNILSSGSFVSSSASIDAGSGNVTLSAQSFVSHCCGTIRTANSATLTSTNSSISFGTLAAGHASASALGSISGTVQGGVIDAISTNGSISLSAIGNLVFGNLSASLSSLNLTASGGAIQMASAASLLTSRFLTLTAMGAIGSAAMPIPVAAGLQQLTIDGDATINLALQGAPTLDRFDLVARATGLGASSAITGAGNLSTLAFSGDGSTLGASLVGTSGLTNFVRIRAQDGHLHVANLQMPGASNASVTLQSDQGNLQVDGLSGGTGSRTLTASNGALTVGSLSTGGFGSVSLSALNDIVIGMVSTASGSVNASSAAGNIRAQDGSSATTEITTTGGTVTLSAAGSIGETTVGPLVDRVFHIDTGATTSTVTLTAGGRIGLDSDSPLIADTNGTFNISAGDLFNVSVPVGHTATRVNITTGSTLGMSTFNSPNFSQSLSSDGSTIALGDISSAAGLTGGFSLRATSGDLSFGNVSLLDGATKLPFSLSADAGMITQALHSSMTAGSVTLTASGDITTEALGTVANPLGSVSVNTAGRISAQGVEATGAVQLVGRFWWESAASIDVVGNIVSQMSSVSTRSDGNTQVSGSVTAVSSVDLETSSGDLNVVNLSSTNGSLDASVGGSLLVAGAVSGRFGVTLNGGTAVSVAGATTSANGNVAMSSSGPVATGNITAASSLVLQGDTISTGNLSGAGISIVQYSGAAPYAPSGITINDTAGNLHVYASNIDLTSATVTLGASGRAEFQQFQPAGHVWTGPLPGLKWLTLDVGGQFQVDSGGTVLERVDISADSTAMAGSTLTGGAGQSFTFDNAPAARLAVSSPSLLDFSFRNTAAADIQVQQIAVAGGEVNLTADQGNLIKDGAGPHITTTGPVTLTALNGGIGSAAGPLVLSGTTDLRLDARDDLNLKSATSLDVLTLTTTGSGAGVLDLDFPNFLNGPGIARSAGNLVLDGATAGSDFSGIVGLLHLDISLRDGSLILRGQGTANIPNLILNPFSPTSDLIIEAVGGPLAWTSASNQYFMAGRDILFKAGSQAGESLSLSSWDQTIFADRDLQFLGNMASVTASATNGQQFTAARDLIFRAGNNPNAFVLVNATGGQSLEASQDIILDGGDAAGAYVAVRTGSFQFTLASRDTVLAAGGGAGSFVELKAANNQNVQSFRDIRLLAGGSGAYAEMRSTGSSQSIGSFSTDHVELIGGNAADAHAGLFAATDQTVRSQFGIRVQAGSGARSDAVIEGDQLVSTNGTLDVIGGAGADAGNLSVARITNTGPSTLQSIGASTITVSAPSAYGEARIDSLSTGGQNISATSVQVTSGASGSKARIYNQAGTQTLSLGQDGQGVSLRVAALGGGTASVESGGNQKLSASGKVVIGDLAALGSAWLKAVNLDAVIGSLAVLGGAGGGANAKIDAAQQLVISTLRGGTQLKAGLGGTASIDPAILSLATNGALDVIADGVGASITGDEVKVAATAGDLSLVGGSGGNADARIAALGGTVAPVIASSADVVLTQGSGANADALLDNLTGVTGNILMGGNCVNCGNTTNTPNQPDSAVLGGFVIGGAITSGPASVTELPLQFDPTNQTLTLLVNANQTDEGANVDETDPRRKKGTGKCS